MEEHKEQGSRAALFPALSEGSREKRAVSILLACMEQVPELTETLLWGQGAPLGKRSKIQAWTEVGSIGGKGAARPDGKIMIRTPRSQQWTALVEAKIGKGRLDAEQIEAYLGSGRTEGVNALITISNDFAVLPTHHPTYEGKVPKGISLLHWSWGSVLTKCRLLTEGGEIEDRDHRWVVEHLVRFLNHPSTGVTLTRTDPSGVHIKAAYGGRRQDTQGALDKVRENPNTLDSVDPKICPKRFEVKLVSDPGRRMEGQKTFVQALEKLAPEFYTQVGQHLRTWVPSAPRVGNTPASNESSGVVKTAGETDGESFGEEGRRTEGGDGPGAEDLHGPDEHGGHTAEGAGSPEPTSGPATLN